MTSATPGRRWRIPAAGPPPDDVPSPWSEAITAVSRDLRHRWHGRNIDLGLIAWELTATTDGYLHIGMTMATGAARLASSSGGAGFTVAVNPAQATVWLAEITQDALTGYAFVQWPVGGQRLLIPKLRRGAAVWVDAATRTVTASIGELTDQPPTR